MRSRILGPVVAAVMAGATGILVAPASAAAAPAAAAACSTASGISVVVDFKELGGGVTAGCDGDAGGPASQNFADAGYQLSYSQAPGMNGFVCKVQGKPADGDCAQTDSFWSLWWSDGKSGDWVFSSRGVGSLNVPEGGYVAFAWHQGGGDAQPPAAVPAAHEEPEPSDPGDSGDGDEDGGGSDGNPGQGGGRDNGPDGSGGSDDDGGDDAPAENDDPSSTPGATPTDGASDGKRDRKADDKRDGKRDRGKGRDEATATPTDPSGSALPEVGDLVDGPPPEATVDEEGSSLPTWIAIGLAVLVLGAAAAVPLIRRRAG